MKNLKVEGHDDLYKDVDTGVINNRSSSDRERYRIAKRQALQNLESQEEIQNLKDEIGEIKQLLHLLISKKS